MGLYSKAVEAEGKKKKQMANKKDQTRNKRIKHERKKK